MAVSCRIRQANIDNEPLQRADYYLREYVRFMQSLIIAGTRASRRGYVQSRQGKSTARDDREWDEYYHLNSIQALHMPRMLNNGHVLIFDNGIHRSYTRLIIIDPVSDKISWEYKANPPESFHSMFEGSSQLLSNGNFFICESNRGRAFEITPGE